VARVAQRPRSTSLAWPRVAAGTVAAAFVVGPLLLARAGAWPGHRDLVTELGSSLGIVSLGLLGLLLVLPSRLGVLERLGADVAVRLHRRVASGLLAIPGAHIVIVVVASPARLRLFRFVGQPWRAQAALCSVIALGLLLVSSLGRRRLRLPYATWRGSHLALALAALVLAVVHTIGWHRYMTTGAGAAGLAGVTAAALLAVIRLRFGRPRQLDRAAYVVERVVPERGRSATLQLRADGHAGHCFRPGQFAWIKLAERRLSLDEHPFSYSSSAAHPDRPSFTVRAYSGFSTTAQQLEPGTRVLVDGPHGGFRPSPRARGMALIAHGIGITPMMSILRTAADTGDPRRFVLVYGNRSAGGITFFEELEFRERRLELAVVHVLSRPDEPWRGLRGRITSDVLAQTLPADLRRWEFFLCGPGPAVESSLLALERCRVPPERVHAERFVEV
jgi:predicted ferric reductase